MGYEKQEPKYEKAYKKESQKLLKVEDVLEYPIIAVESYGISQECAEYFEIRSEVSEEDGTTPTKTYFPYYNQQGKICGYKGRNWGKSKKEKGHIFTVGEVSIGVKLFGQQQAEKNRTGNKLIIVEGEGDVTACWEGGMAELEGTEWEGKIFPCVVGLSHGTGNCVAAITANEQFIREYEKKDSGKICLGFDNDQATIEERNKGIIKGWDAVEEVAGFLMSDKIYTYDFGGYKDPREFVMDGQTIVLGKLLAFKHKKYHPEKIVSARDVSIERLVKPREEGLYIDALPELMKKIHGFRKRELVLITSPSGGGKCFAKGTEILMYDGSIKPVEDIFIGDVVMGADGTPRNVLSTHFGYDDMYLVKQVKGADYVVNSKHTLCLTPSIDFKQRGWLAGQEIEIDVEDYLKLSEYCKANLKGYKGLIKEARKQPKRHYVTDVTVESAGYGDYYGFEVDGDHKFMLSDFTVVHNSSLVTEIMDDLLIKHDKNIGAIYLEEVVEETILRLIARRLGVNYNSIFKFDPLKVVSEADFIEAKGQVESNLFLIDHFGSIASDVLIRKIKYLEHVCKCDFVILDHLSMVFSGTKTTDERKLVDELMTSLSSYVATSDVGVIAVSHMKRKPFLWNTDFKTKEKLPTWVEVDKTDLRSSGALEQMSWVIIGIEPEIMPDRTNGRIRLVVLKNRPWSMTGECDILRMDSKTGLFEDASCEDIL